MSTASPAALAVGPYRVERLTRDGRTILRVTFAGQTGRVVVADCDTAENALDVLVRRGVPLSELVLLHQP